MYKRQAVLDADKNYSIRAVLAVRDKRMSEILDPVLSFRGHAYSRAGVAAFTTSTGYGIDVYKRQELLPALVHNTFIGKWFFTAGIWVTHVLSNRSW